MKIEGNHNFNRDFSAEMILSQCIINSNDIESACQKLLGHIDVDYDRKHKASNQQRRLILQNCLDLFKDPVVIERIEKIRKQEALQGKALVKRILQEYYVRIFDDHKRTYDMSNKYNPSSIAEIDLPNGTRKKQVAFSPSSDFLLSLNDSHGNEITFEKLGVLEYITNFWKKHKSLIKYRITFKSEDKKDKPYEVFSRIDINRMKKDKNYFQLVLDELLNRNNLELANANGYIGEILPSTPFDDDLQPGEQKLVEHDFIDYYLYKPDKTNDSNFPSYLLGYDLTALSAVMYHAQKSAKSKEDDSFQH